MKLGISLIGLLISIIISILPSCKEHNKVLNLNITGDTLLLENVNIIDVNSDTLLQNMNIIIMNKHIKDIYRNGDYVNPPNIPVLNLSNHYVIPGLIDAHVHISSRSEKNLTLALESGITMLRDMGGDAEYIYALQERIDSNSFQGPDVYFSAIMAGHEFINNANKVKQITPMKYELGKAPWARAIDDESDIEQIIREAKDCGATAIKMYAYLTKSQVEKLTAEAHLQGLKVWSHSVVYPAMCEEVVTAGVDVISHFDGIIAPANWNYETDAGKLMLDADALKSEHFNRILDKMVENRSMLDPTLTIFEWVLNTRINEENRDAYFQIAMNTVKKVFKKGIPIVAGTDIYLSPNENGKFPLLRELEMYVDYVGMSPIQAIKCATLNGAKALGVEDKYGSIEIGKIANLVVLTKNPSKNISNISSAFLVIKNGRPVNTIID